MIKRKEDLSTSKEGSETSCSTKSLTGPLPDNMHMVSVLCGMLIFRKQFLLSLDAYNIF